MNPVVGVAIEGIGINSWFSQTMVSIEINMDVNVPIHTYSHICAHTYISYLCLFKEPGSGDI